MPVYVRDLWYGIPDQCGPGRLFGSVTARNNAVAKGLLHPGHLINNRRKNTGEQLNDFIARCQTKPKTVPVGFGGKQAGAGRPRTARAPPDNPIEP
jgi:hypothetical protein